MRCCLGSSSGLKSCCCGRRTCNCATSGQAALTPSAELPAKTHPNHLHKHVVVILGPCASIPDIGDVIMQKLPSEGHEVDVKNQPLLALIFRCLNRPVDQVQSSMCLGADLGLDSLGWLDLLAAMETELDVFIDESQISEDPTLDEIAALIGQPRESTQEPYKWEWPLSRLMRLARAATHTLLLFPVLKVWVPHKVQGRQHLSGLWDPIVFASNHLSLLDTPIILAALPRRWCLRIATLAATHVLYSRGRIAVLLASFWFNAFPFSQNPPIRPSLEHCRSLLDRGWSILMYPEGRRTDNGQMGHFKPGVGLMAVDLRVPVVPVLVIGTDEVMPNRRIFPHRGRVEVHFGKPLRFSARSSYLDTAASIEAAVKSLASEAIR